MVHLLDQFMEDAFGIDPDDDVVNIELLNDTDPELRELLEIFSQRLTQTYTFRRIINRLFKKYISQIWRIVFKKHFKNNLLVRLEVMEGKYVYPICNGLGVLFYIVIDPVTNDFEILEEDDILAFQLNPTT